jgi:hypothetical protein
LQGKQVKTGTIQNQHGQKSKQGKPTSATSLAGRVFSTICCGLSLAGVLNASRHASKGMTWYNEYQGDDTMEEQNEQGFTHRYNSKG